MGATEFAWSALIMELVTPDPRAANSYLPEPAEVAQAPARL
jgi:hypothetical protein